jgi:hypothetical protein
MRPLVLALALIAAAPIATNAQTTEPREPRSCQRLQEETSKCEAGMRNCDQHVIAGLQAQCQRDEKRLAETAVMAADPGEVRAGGLGCRPGEPGGSDQLISRKIKPMGRTTPPTNTSRNGKGELVPSRKASLAPNRKREYPGFQAVIAR